LARRKIGVAALGNNHYAAPKPAANHIAFYKTRVAVED
jgi:hypothetical protein